MCLLAPLKKVCAAFFFFSFFFCSFTVLYLCYIFETKRKKTHCLLLLVSIQCTTDQKQSEQIFKCTTDQKHEGVDRHNEKVEY